MDYIDLVLIHAPGLPSNFIARNPAINLYSPEVVSKIAEIKDLAEARIELWEALQFCQNEGKIRHIGVSNFTRYHVEQLIKNPR